MPRPARPLLLCLALAACGAPKDETTGFQSTGSGPSSFDDPTTGAPTTDTPTTGDPTTSATAAPTTGDPATTSSGEDATTVPTTTTDPTTGAPPPTCGDGEVDPGEQCDDGNTDDGDRCLSDCTDGAAIVAVVGRGDEPAAIATFTAASGWSVAPADYDVADAAVVATASGAIAVVRRAGAVPDAKDELWSARWSPQDPALLQTAAKVGAFGFTLHTPSLAAVQDDVTLAFLGTDFKHYTSVWSDDAWQPFAPLPAATLDVQAFGPSGATLAAAPPATWAVYAGDDDKVYVARKPQPDAAWEASVQAPPPAVVDAIRPAAVVEPNGDLVLAYVRNADDRVGLTRRSLAEGTWSLEVQVDPQARTAAPPALLRTDAGGWLLAWQNLENPGITYAAGAAFDAWDAPVTVEIPAATTPPRLVAGALGADAELLWTADGAPRHARILAGAATPASAVADVTAATSVAAARVQRAP